MITTTKHEVHSNFRAVLHSIKFKVAKQDGCSPHTWYVQCTCAYLHVDSRYILPFLATYYVCTYVYTGTSFAYFNWKKMMKLA